MEVMPATRVVLASSQLVWRRSRLRLDRAEPPPPPPMPGPRAEVAHPAE